MRLRSSMRWLVLLAWLAAACEPDDFVAPWPQSNVEPRTYDESGPAGPLRTKAAAHDPFLGQLGEDLADFPAPPNRWRLTPARAPGSYTLDPLSSQLVDLWALFPWLADLFGLVHLQALEAFPVTEQYMNGFQWQHDPFVIEECGSDDPTQVEPGVAFLAAYWLAAYHKLVQRGA